MKSYVFILMLLLVHVINSTTWPDKFTHLLPTVDTAENKLEFNQSLNINDYSISLGIKNHSEYKNTHTSNKVEYRLEDNNSTNSKTNYLDLSGNISYNRRIFKFFSSGVNWYSYSVAKIDSPSGNSVTSLKIAPELSFRYKNIPVRFMVGSAVDLWNNNMKYSISEIKKEDLQSDAGFFTGLYMGDYSKQLIDKIPFYAQGEIYGIYITNSKITYGNINTLFYNKIFNDDSIFIAVSDTVSKGRTAFFKENNLGITEYSTTLNKTQNRINALIGLKNIGNFFIKPSILYSFDARSFSYPNKVDNLDDQLNLLNTGTVLWQADSNKILNFNGSFYLGREKEDWLYTAKLPDNAVATQNNEDSLRANENDFDGYISEITNSICRIGKLGIKISYDLALKKYKKLYPNYYSYPYLADTSTIRYDKEEIRYYHKIDISWLSTERISVSNYLSFRKNMDIYLRKERSGSNTLTRIYELETRADINTPRNRSISEIIGVIAEVQELPEYVIVYLEEIDGEIKPYMSRKSYSKFSWDIPIKYPFNIVGYWYEIFKDIGYTDKDNVYRIEKKYLESDLQVACRLFFQNGVLFEAGSDIQKILNWQFNNELNYYELINSTKYNFDLAPFATVRLYSPKIIISSTIKSNLTLNSENNTKLRLNYWEAIAKMEVMF